MKDFIIAAIAGFSYLILTGIMLWILMIRKEKHRKHNWAYFIPSPSIVLTILSLKSLIMRIKIYAGYRSYLIAGVILFLVICVILFVSLLETDRRYLKTIYSSEQTYIKAPWYYILVTTLVSSAAITVLLAWFVYICCIPI